MAVSMANSEPQSGRRSAKQPGTTKSGRRKYLPEVQGLRALAVLMVVAYHVWFGRISGGVDIFLLVSAFLLTGQFTRKLESGKGLKLVKYWVHLFKRLLPLITVTLLATLAATWMFLPKIEWGSIFSQTWASLFYYQNWFLAAESVDYYATDHSQASPLQHFWSLSIQGQIFILWPLIFAAAALISRRGRLKIRPLLIYIFGGIFLVSLLFSIVTTRTNQSFAYFDTRTRLWEFALGSLLALLLPYIRVGRGARIFLGWLGVVAMLSCGLILQVGQQFPGYMALWPTLAAACIIVAGFTDSKFGADRLLSWKPLVKLGDSSYALYLFHWPLLVVFLVVSGRDHAGPKAGLAIVLVSVVAAIFATKYIDTPLRRNKWIEKKRRRAVVVIALCIALVAVPLSAWQVQLSVAEQAALSQAEKNNPGAAALRPGYIDEVEPGAPMLPSLATLGKQWVGLPESCATEFKPQDAALAKICAQSKVDGEAAKTIVVVGDSHSEQWMGALIPVAEKHHWQLVSVLKGGCDFGSEAESSGRPVECVDYNNAVEKYVLDLKPDAVYTMSTDAKAESPDESVITGFSQSVKTFTKAGIEVIGVRDNPRFSSNKAKCVADGDVAACNYKKSEYLAASDPAASLNEIKGAFMLDLTDRLCAGNECSPVIGNVLAYMDDNHLTKTYTTTMAPDLEERLLAATKWK